MKSKFWLRAAMLVLAASMILCAMAGCGEKPAESDPDNSDYSDVSDSTTTAGDADATTTSGEDATTGGEDATTTTGTGTNAPTKDNGDSTKTTTASKTAGSNALGNVDGGGSTNDTIDSGNALGVAKASCFKKIKVSNKTNSQKVETEASPAPEGFVDEH